MTCILSLKYWLSKVHSVPSHCHFTNNTWTSHKHFSAKIILQVAPMQLKLNTVKQLVPCSMIFASCSSKMIQLWHCTVTHIMVRTYIIRKMADRWQSVFGQLYCHTFHKSWQFQHICTLQRMCAQDHVSLVYFTHKWNSSEWSKI